jgi:hypothetical protein
MTVVVFEETNEERAIVKWCLKCQADSDFSIVSPQGTAHYGGKTSERTRCGFDATSAEWWHRL